MIGKDDKQDEVTFKVADRRKFNPDGSLKEGVTLEPVVPRVDKAAGAAASELASARQKSAPSQAGLRTDPTANGPRLHEETGGEIADDDSDVPGAEDPASFVNFLSTLATNAAAALGAMPHPATGKRTVDLDTGKYWLDVLAMLREKTQGNLHPRESRLLDGLLADLRMQYVQLVRATEEKLKAQAAKKFSGADILGKK